MIKNLNGIVIPFTMFIIAQTGAGIWWAAQTENRVRTLEVQYTKMDETLDKLNESINQLNITMSRINAEHDFLLGQGNKLNNIAK